jgi:quercetin dioxygenase-like cupin family protein
MAETVLKRLLGILLLLPLMGTAPSLAQTMKVSPNGARASVPGPTETFTGIVTVTPLFAPSELSNAGGGLVEFTPGARSAWHTHPAGQTLVVTEGVGWVQEEGGAKIEIKPGDVIWTPPGVKHWHGATANTSVSHIAITLGVNGANVMWLEKVTDEQYAR